MIFSFAVIYYFTEENYLMAESKLRTLSVDFAVHILNLVKFGELFGVSARKVSEWEHGKSLPDASLQNKISDLRKGIGNG